MKVYIIGIVTALLLVGCATTPIPSAQAKPVPSDRLLAFQEKKAETTSTLVVTRDVGFLGSGCYIEFSINGIMVANVDVGETAHFFVTPGELVFKSALNGAGLCALNKDYWTQRETIIRANEIKFFRLSSSIDGLTDIQRGEK